MLKNPRVIGVKNSSMPVQDIEEFRAEGCMVFNGPDEQLLSGLVAGATGGIGGTYGAMPELYLKIYELVRENRIQEARAIQDACLKIIIALCGCKGNMYAVIKAVLRKMGAPDCGGVRAPLYDLVPEDEAQVDKCVDMIRAAYEAYL
jgi:N-acetylneuraminate lyase